MGTTRIEWTDCSWNPVTGCTAISPGCENCYAERIAMRLRNNPRTDKYRNGFQVTFHPRALSEPMRWKRPRRIFVCSMGDIFHPDVDVLNRAEIFDVMWQTPRHTYQILTKRPEREHMGKFWAENMWYGVSVEHRDYMSRVDVLRESSARVKFISFEPLLGCMWPIDLNGIDWVIVGGETGPYARDMKIEWVRGIRDACVEQGVPFFFKQWGGRKSGLRWLDGREWNEYPNLGF